MDICQYCGWEIARPDWYHRYNGKLICDNCVMDTMSERERGYEMNKEMKEIDEVLTNLWWNAEISDTTKLWWNDHYREILEKELAK